jgi:acetyl esterase/lipase
MRLILIALTLTFSSAVAAGAQTAAKVVAQKDLIYGRVEGSALLADLAVPDGPGLRPAIVSIHGGRWRAGNRTDASSIKVEQWAELGFVAMSIDYRLVGGSPAPAAYLDTLCAIRWVHAHADEYRIDPNRVYLIGQSAGGHLVSLVATLGDGPFAKTGGWDKARSDVRAVISVAGPYELNTLSWGNLWTPVSGVAEDARTLASPITHVSAATRPTLIIHSDDDKSVPIRSGGGNGRAAQERRRASPLRPLHRSRAHGDHRRSDQGSESIHRRGRTGEMTGAAP